MIAVKMLLKTDVCLLACRGDNNDVTGSMNSLDSMMWQDSLLHWCTKRHDVTDSYDC
jgi:hypothetical protein